MAESLDRWRGYIGLIHAESAIQQFNKAYAASDKHTPVVLTRETTEIIIRLANDEHFKHQF